MKTISCNKIALFCAIALSFMMMLKVSPLTEQMKVLGVAETVLKGTPIKVALTGLETKRAGMSVKLPFLGQRFSIPTNYESNIWIKVGDGDWKPCQGVLQQCDIDGNMLVGCNPDGEVFTLNFSVKDLKNDAWLQDYNKWKKVETGDKKIRQVGIRPGPRSIIALSDESGENIWEYAGGQWRNIPGQLRVLSTSAYSKLLETALWAGLNAAGSAYIRHGRLGQNWIQISLPKNAKIAKLEVGTMSGGLFVLMALDAEGHIYYVPIFADTIKKIEETSQKRFKTMELNWQGPLEMGRLVDIAFSGGTLFGINASGEFYERSGLTIANIGSQYENKPLIGWKKVEGLPESATQPTRAPKRGRGEGFPEGFVGGPKTTLPAMQKRAQEHKMKLEKELKKVKEREQQLEQEIQKLEPAQQKHKESPRWFPWNQTSNNTHKKKWYHIFSKRS